MSEMRRLLDCGTAGERALLRAAGRDRPSTREARSRALAALGLTGVVGTAAAAQAGAVKGAANVMGVSLIKWSVVVAVGVATAAAAIVSSNDAGPSPAVATATAPTHVPHVASAPPPGGSASPTQAPATIESAAKTVATNSSPPVSPGKPREPSDEALSAGTSESAPPPPPPPSASFARSADILGEQIAALDRGRAALVANDALGCLREIDDFHRRFPTGALAPEAAVLEVRARLAAGDRISASALARRFGQENPNSPYRSRVLEIISEP